LEYNNNIIIMGMPRTGTSLVTNLLSDAGWNLDAGGIFKMMGKDEYNKKGYFEVRNIIKINDQLMRANVPYSSFLQPYDVDGDFPLHEQDYYEAIPMVNDYTRRDNWNMAHFRTLEQLTQHRNYIEFCYNNLNQPWAIKDVRFPFTLGQWNLKYHKIIITQRHPDATYASMQNIYGSIFNRSIVYGDHYVNDFTSFKKYCDIYGSAINSVTQHCKNVFYVDFKELQEGNIQGLELFVGMELNKSVIDKNLVTAGGIGG